MLLIDDCSALRSLVRAVLEADGHEVATAADAMSGVAAAKADPPDMILLDVQLPDADGFEVCELLQVQAETAGVPVIFLSAAGEPDDRVRGLNLGAADFVVKPFHAEELRARVRVALRYRQLLAMQERRSMRDGLTGLWNRAFLNERLAAECAVARRHGRPLSCVMLDIDRFKSINDAHGHSTGDDAIRALAGVLENARRREDLACRYGGEEFVVLCPGVDVAGAALFAERLRQLVAGHPIATAAGATLAFTASFGVADLAAVDGNDEGRTMLEAADAALYAAKRGGRNQVRVAGVPGPDAASAAIAAAV